ncbi:MAG: hypothetical protein V1744_00660 [Candidatus Altiarchaeota archaeon]
MRKTVSIIVLAVLLPGLVDAMSTAFYTRICSETDSGLDYPMAGTTKDATGNYSDLCMDSVKLVEWYCDNGRATFAMHACPHGCVWGRCVSSNPNMMSGPYECDDSDGGVVLSVKGFLDDVRVDKCITTTRLREWYCWDNTPKSTTRFCGGRCEDGACKTTTTTTTSTTLPTLQAFTTPTTASTTSTTTLQAYCIESDWGRAPEDKGVTKIGNTVRTDDCVGYKRIREWYCSENRLRFAYFKCPNICLDGACK